MDFTPIYIFSHDMVTHHPTVTQQLDSPRMIVAIIKFDPEVAEQSISVSLWKWATTDDPHHVIRKANLPYKLDE